MTNLKTAGGRVPITNRGINTNTPYLLVDFPSREVFDLLYKRVKPSQRDKYWDIINRRRAGASLVESGKPYALSREYVRQIEAKFCRLVGNRYWNEVTASLSILSAITSSELERI